MQHATDKTVLGNFNDASFDYYGVHSRFFRKDGKFLVETDGPDGKLAVFEVKYTFGVDPLQQYLVEFPDGRLQALSLAWDSRPQDKGGQRWFHLSPNEEIRHDDILHWTKLNQNWNFMCAECHSTGLRKNYDAKTDRFATTWAEISVGCETCHGQGSAHAAWARDQQSWWPFGKREDSSKGLLVRFDERRDVTWPIDPQTGNAQAQRRAGHAAQGGRDLRAVPRAPRRLPRGLGARSVAVADPCRSKRWRATPIMPTARSAMSRSRTIIRRSSRARCSPPASPAAIATSRTARNFAASGEGVCLQCHASGQIRRREASPPRERRPAADLHLVPHAGAHLHGGRSPPRSRLSRAAARSLGHAGDAERLQRLPPRQAARNGPPTAVEQWFGPDRKGFQTYGAGVPCRAHRRRPMPPRCSARSPRTRMRRPWRAPARLRELASRVSPANIAPHETALADPDPMVRIGALDMLENVPAGQIWPLASPLLADPVRGVRIRAASLLASVPTASQPPPDRARFDQAATEFIAAQRANAERPEARTTLANFLARRGQTADAEAEYKAALKLSPQYATAAINLADLYRQLGRDGDGETVLRAAHCGITARRGRASRARPDLDAAEAARRGARRIAEGNRAGAGPFALRLCLRRRAAFRRPCRDEAMTVLKRSPEKPSQRSGYPVGAGFVQSRGGRCKRRARLRRTARGDHAGGSELGGADRGTQAADGQAELGRRKLSGFSLHPAPLLHAAGPKAGPRKM